MNQLFQIIRGASIVWRRQFHVYRNTALFNCLPPLSEPIVYLIGFGYGMGPLVGQVHYFGVSVDYVRFLVGGMIGVGILLQSYLEGAYSTFIRVMYQRTWHAQLTSPLTFADIFFGELSWATTKGVFAGVLTGIVGICWGAMSFGELLTIFPFIVLGGVVFGAFGMVSAGLAKRIDFVNVPLFLFVVPMFALCGTYFPRTTLPLPFQAVVSILPVSALVDLLRFSIHPPQSTLVSLVYLLVWGAAFIRFAWITTYRKIYR